MADSISKGFRFVIPADSLQDDDARFFAHLAVMGAVLTLVLLLIGSITIMSIWYWGG